MRSPSAPVRILSIDGGGIRGLIPALVLEKLGALIAEAQVGKKDDGGPLAQHFDLICGASTGAIIAVGTAGCQNPDERLATPHALVHLYADEAATVFVGDRRGMTCGLFGPKYQQPLSGGDHQAHPSAIQGVLTLADRLISWSADGVVRFWTLEGEPRPDTWIAPTPLQFVALKSVRFG